LREQRYASVSVLEPVELTIHAVFLFTLPDEDLLAALHLAMPRPCDLRSSLETKLRKLDEAVQVGIRAKHRRNAAKNRSKAVEGWLHEVDVEMGGTSAAGKS
jgi:hypothetical protein